MVVAPSKIIINSNVNAENYKLKNDNDNTIKAIIGYPLAEGDVVDEDPSDIVMTISIGDDVISTIEAFSLRYCYVDDNLIVEFDRSAVVRELLSGEVLGWVDVEVAGSFNVVDADGVVAAHEIYEIATILVSDPQSAK
ncbi:hypothetical protein [Desulfosarcina cetonica]|uniref:hypothetical protein n=1 Tax=Desulfosarcina cetonica TaxID=90730 RepID=UPI001C471BF3|nr:hypothetical protein [Desulfosarcina cetonica]